MADPAVLEFARGRAEQVERSARERFGECNGHDRNELADDLGDHVRELLTFPDILRRACQLSTREAIPSRSSRVIRLVSPPPGGDGGGGSGSTTCGQSPASRGCRPLPAVRSCRASPDRRGRPRKRHGAKGTPPLDTDPPGAGRGVPARALSGLYFASRIPVALFESTIASGRSSPSGGADTPLVRRAPQPGSRVPCRTAAAPAARRKAASTNSSHNSATSSRTPHVRWPFAGSVNRPRMRMIDSDSATILL